MKVEIWSDIVCPFCYIGKRRFENALEMFEAKDNVEIIWRSFQLDPGMEYVPGQSVHEYLGRRKGVTTGEGKKMNDSMAAMAKEEGLVYNFDIAVINNTMDAHRMLHLAKKQGLQDEMKERIFEAYYTEGKNIGDFDTLVKLGEEVGMAGYDIKNMLRSDAYKNDVYQDQNDAQQIGANGVPFYVFNDKYAVSGAQPAALFKQVLDKIREEEKELLVSASDENFCTTGGLCN